MHRVRARSLTAHAIAGQAPTVNGKTPTSGSWAKILRSISATASSRMPKSSSSVQLVEEITRAGLSVRRLATSSAYADVKSVNCLFAAEVLMDKPTSSARRIASSNLTLWYQATRHFQEVGGHAHAYMCQHVPTSRLGGVYMCVYIL